MNIKTTDFNNNYYGCTEAGSRTYACQFYTLHQIDVFNTIIIDGIEHELLYQPGNGFLHNDYNCPDPDLSLYSTNCSDLIKLMESMSESDFDALNSDDLVELKECCSSIKTADDAFEIYQALNENLISAQAYMDRLELEEYQQVEED
jgi:hypothetical protein